METLVTETHLIRHRQRSGRSKSCGETIVFASAASYGPWDICSIYCPDQNTPVVELCQRVIAAATPFFRGVERAWGAWQGQPTSRLDVAQGAEGGTADQLFRSRGPGQVSLTLSIFTRLRVVVFLWDRLGNIDGVNIDIGRWNEGRGITGSVILEV